jgi:hypothetical protein
MLQMFFKLENKRILFTYYKQQTFQLRKILVSPHNLFMIHTKEWTKILCTS